MARSFSDARQDLFAERMRMFEEDTVFNYPNRIYYSFIRINEKRK